MTGPENPPPARTRASDAAFAALALAVALRIGWQWRGIESDDNLIPLRYVRNLLDGQGWVFNSGEHVNGCTSALNTLLIAIVAAATGNPKDAAAVVFGVGLAACAFFIYLAFRSRGLPPAWFAGGIVLFSNLLPGSVGLEMSPTLGLVAATLWVYSAGRLRLASVLLGLVFLSRPDGLLLWVLVAGHFLLTAGGTVRARMLKLVECGGIALAVTIPWLVFSKIYFGSLLPNTVGVKLAQGPSRFWGEGPIFLNGIFQWLPYLTLNPGRWFGWPVYAAFAAWGALVTLAWSRRHMLLLLWPAALTWAYVRLNVPPYHWYYTPLHFGMLAMVAVGFEHAWGLSAAESSPRPRAFFRLVLAAYALALIQPVFPDFTKIVPPQSPHYRAAAAWFREHTPETASIACAEIGVIGYHSEARRIVDINGLVTAGAREAISRGNFAWWYERHKPDYVLFHDPVWPAENAVARMDDFRTRYDPVHRIDQFDGLKLVIYQRKDQPAEPVMKGEADGL